MTLVFAIRSYFEFDKISWNIGKSFDHHLSKRKFQFVVTKFQTFVRFEWNDHSYLGMIEVSILKILLLHVERNKHPLFSIDF